MTAREFLADPNSMIDSFRRERAKCKDGFSISIQQSGFHYCDYNSVELGFPNHKEPLIMQYAEDSSKPTKTVYGWVPLDVIDAVVAKHGGII